MTTSQTEFLEQLLKKLTKTDYIKPGEFPNINLYMDQITTFMNTHLSESKLKSDEKILTKTMINNYAKNDLLPPPVNKKYSKDHMIVLIFIYYFKSMLSISDIQKMLGPLTDRFFDASNNSGHITMEDVYEGVYTSIKSQISTVGQDIFKKDTAATSHFTDVKDEDDKEFLQRFSMICMLAFDIFLKKQVMESLISEMNPTDKDSPNKKN